MIMTTLWHEGQKVGIRGIDSHCLWLQYNTNQIYNARKVTPKCESEARIVSHQVNSN